MIIIAQIIVRLSLSLMCNKLHVIISTNNKMATEIVVITKSDLNINFTYEATEPLQSTFASPWNDESLYVHIPIPPPLTIQNIKVVRIDDIITIQEDQIRTQLIIEGLWQTIRMRRNLLLSGSDWTQLPDAQLTPEKKQQYTDYRQQLRDIPQSSGDPNSVTWPIDP